MNKGATHAGDPTFHIPHSTFQLATLRASQHFWPWMRSVKKTSTQVRTTCRPIRRPEIDGVATGAAAQVHIGFLCSLSLHQRDICQLSHPPERPPLSLSARRVTIRENARLKCRQTTPQGTMAAPPGLRKFTQRLGPTTRAMAARESATRESSSSAPFPVPSSPHSPPSSPRFPVPSSPPPVPSLDGDGAVNLDGPGAVNPDGDGDGAANAEPDGETAVHPDGGNLNPPANGCRAQDSIEDSDVDVDGPAIANKAHVLSFTFGLPHLPEPQRVHLCFEPTWTPQPPVAICFRTPDDVLFWPAGAGPVDAQDNFSAHHQPARRIAIPFNPVAIPLDPVDPLDPIDLHQQLPRPSEPAPRLPDSRLWWWTALLGALLSITVSILASQLLIATKTWTSLTEPDPTLEFAGPFIRIVDDMVNVTLFAEQQLFLAPSSKTMDLRDVGWDSWDKVGKLCRYQNEIPNRPDVHQYCAEFEGASKNFRDTFRDGAYPGWRSSSVGLLRDVANALENRYYSSKEDDGDNAEMDRLARRQRDASIVSYILLWNLSLWQKLSLYPFQALVKSQERYFSIMLETGDLIFQVFTYETNRRTFQPKGYAVSSPLINPGTDVVFHSDAKFISPSLDEVEQQLPVMKRVLAHLEASEELVEGLVSRQAAFKVALDELVTAGQADKSRNAILLRLGWIPSAPALEDTFYAFVKLKDAVQELRRRGEPIPGFFYLCYGNGCWDNNG
ncbi:hypothetical protein QBC39DRAFT_360127 [Podospora conica]|nr:hypothetical protein QBC39DRAFT_360127 [Schizothecium conicum]